MSLIEYVLLGRNSYTNWFLSEDKKDYEIVEKALNKLNLQTKKNQMVKTLSGGEMQRATLSRALAQEANLLLFCLLYTSPSPRDKRQSRMPSSA